MARNTEKRAERETHTINSKICQETVKNVNNEKYSTWILAKILKNVENETKTQLDLEYAEKH